MIIYLFNVISIGVYSLILRYSKISKPRRDDVVIALVFLQMTIIAGMRGLSVGVDTKTYKWIFETASYMNFSNMKNFYIDTGFMLLNKFVYIIGGNYRTALFFFAGLMYYLFYVYIKNNSINKKMSVFLFITLGYFASSLNVIRQFISLGFVLISYSKIVKKERIINVIIPCLIATFIHKTSFLCIAILLVYWIITNDRIKGRNFLKYFVYIGAVIGIGFVARILSVLGADISYIQEGAAFTYSLISIGFLMKVCLAVLGIYASKVSFNSERKAYINFFNFLNIFSIILNILSVKYSMFTRLNIFFSFPMIVYLPEYVKYIPVKNKNLMRAMVCCAFICMYCLDLLNNNSGIVPYNTLLY